MHWQSYSMLHLVRLRKTLTGSNKLREKNTLSLSRQTPPIVQDQLLALVVGMVSPHTNSII